MNTAFFIRSDRNFHSAEAGSVSIMFGLTSLVAFGFMGLALDYNRALAVKKELQFAVDQSAIAGASLPATANQNRITQAKKFFTANVRNSALASLQPDVNASNAGVTVRANYEYPTVLMKLWRVDSLALRAKGGARSQIQNGGVACLIALNPTTDNGLHLQGVNKLTSNDCWAWVNSTHPYSINAVGASIGKAQGFCTAGKVLGAEHFLPAPYTECEPIPDPFAAKSAPADGTCTATNLSLKNVETTLNPGTYCGGIVLKPQAKVTFNPGVYIIKDGMFEIQGQASAAGDGVVFVFKGLNAEFIVRGGGSVAFKAPKADATNVAGLNGFVLFQDRITALAGRTTIIQGGGSVKIEGILYMPTWRVDIGGNGDVNQGAQYFTMVADSFYMEGNGKLFLASDAAGAQLPDLMPRIKNGPMLIE